MSIVIAENGGMFGRVGYSPSPYGTEKCVPNLLGGCPRLSYWQLGSVIIKSARMIK